MLFIILVFFIVIKGLNDANLISDSEEIKSISGVCVYITWWCSLLGIC
jgi:hypothetical protein